MANKQIGEVTLTTSHGPMTLRFGSYAIAELESELDRPFLSIALELEDAKKRKMRTILACLWAALREHHPGVETLRDAARIMDDVGFIECGMKVADAMNLAFPDPEEGSAGPLPNRKERRAARATAR